MRKKLELWTADKSITALEQFINHYKSDIVVADVIVRFIDSDKLLEFKNIRVNVSKDNSARRVSIFWEDMGVAREERNKNKLLDVYYPESFNMIFKNGVLKIYSTYLIEITKHC